MNNEVNKLIPDLRFPEFVDEGDWNEKTVGDIYDFKVTNSFSRENLNYDKGLVKNIHYGDIHTKFNTLFDITKEKVPYINVSVPIEKIKQESFCVEGDMIFADASEDLSDIGKSIEIVNLDNQRLLSGLHTLLARQKTQKLVKGFAGHLFKTYGIRNQIQREAQGAKVLGISVGRISNVNISFPENPKEQQKIASCLSSLDEVIAAHNQKLKVLKEHKKGLMQNLFPQEGETVPKKRFPGFLGDGDWADLTLGDIGKITSGGTPSRSNSEFWNGDIPWVSTTLIDFNTITQAKEFITEAGLINSSTKIFPKNTILMAMYGQGKTRGKVAILGIEAATNQACAAIILKKKYVTDFVFQYISAHYEDIRELSNQGGQENLSGGLIEKIQISIPEAKEQQKIAECLSSLDSTIAAEAEKIDQLKLHKKGLMQGMFPINNEPK